MRRSTTRMALLAGFAVLPAAFAVAQSPSPADVRALALQWLKGNCGVGEATEDKLARVGAPLVASFVEALQNGPPAAEIAEVERSASRRYEGRAEALKNGEDLGLNAEALEPARKVTRDEYVARERRNFDSRYRSQAISGLAIVGGPDAKVALERLARDKGSPLSSLAAQALSRMARTGKR